MCQQGHNLWDNHKVHGSLLGLFFIPFSAGNTYLEDSLTKAMAICLKRCMPLSLLLSSLFPLLFPYLLTNTSLTSFLLFMWLAFIACLYYC